jgi:hypothetical protein
VKRISRLTTRTDAERQLLTNYRANDESGQRAISTWVEAVLRVRTDVRDMGQVREDAGHLYGKPASRRKQRTR